MLAAKKPAVKRGDCHVPRIINHHNASCGAWGPGGNAERLNTMAQVETVRGPVDIADLGTTLMHEHVFVLSEEIRENYGGSYWDEEVRVADAIEKLRRLKSVGVSTI